MNSIVVVLAFVHAHHAEFTEAGTIFAGIAAMIIKFALNVKPLTSWLDLAETNPRVLAFARLLSAIGINPINVLQAVIDLIAGRASKGTIAWARAFKVSASRPLVSPVNKPSERVTPVDPTL